jgi:hypothetical protein
MERAHSLAKAPLSAAKVPDVRAMACQENGLVDGGGILDFDLKGARLG